MRRKRWYILGVALGSCLSFMLVVGPDRERRGTEVLRQVGNDRGNRPRGPLERDPARRRDRRARGNDTITGSVRTI